MARLTGDHCDRPVEVLWRCPEERGGDREVGRWLNNREENSHLPFRRHERAMLRFRRMHTLQKFASVHASVHNHFPTERHLQNRDAYK